MGWRDGMKFRKWLKDHFPEVESDGNESDMSIFRAAYEEAFETGWRESQTYDPKWDSD